MKKIILSTFTIVSLSTASLYADQTDDIMASKSFKQSTETSKAQTRASGSSNKNSAAADKVQLEQFAATNSDQLAKEIAAGHGETLDTLSTLLKVEDKATFNAKLQANYSKIYTSQDVSSKEVLNNISNI